MLTMVLGIMLAVSFFGLPLAIIGLFIVSILDRRNKSTIEGYKESRLIGPKHLFRRARLEPEGSAPYRLNWLAAERRPG